MRLQADTKDYFNNLEISNEEFYNYFSNDWDNVEKYIKEYDKLWDDWILEESIRCHKDYGGEIAGSGTLDYVEGRILYCLVRSKNPYLMFELGVAQGVSTCIIAEALLQNNSEGTVLACDINNPTTPCKYFNKYVDSKIIYFEQKDVFDFLYYHEDRNPEIIFTDCDHDPKFVQELVEYEHFLYPNATHVYHERSFSPTASEEDIQHVSRTEWLYRFTEKDNFEKYFTQNKYYHYGFVGSCGIGVVERK